MNEIDTTASGTAAGNGGRKDQLRKYASLAPNLVKLVYRLGRDPRVPARTKAILVVVAGYLASPIDLIPDFIAGFGFADDLMIAAFALDQVLNRVDEAIVREHWDGDQDILQVIREIVDIASGFVPSRIKKLLGAK